MKDYFKNLNTLTQNIKRKIYKIKTQDLLQLCKNGKKLLEKSSTKNLIPLKITKEQVLKVEVSNDILLDFTFSNQIYLKKIDMI